MDFHYDLAVIGGGIIGLATALDFGRRFPRQKIGILEKERSIGLHQTGHNSGVVHSGIYYRQGSDKARLCVEGARLLQTFCEANGIPYVQCGKVIVATEESELSRLQLLYDRGLANSVPGLEIIEPDRLKEIEPHAQAVRALHSPQTAIVDYRAVAHAMGQRISSQNGSIMTATEVIAIVQGVKGVVLQTTRGDVEAKHVINCAGLYADRLAKMMGERPALQIIPFRGEYYRLRPERKQLVNALIYPVPDPTFPFLGVHFTKKISGEVEAGPNAVLAFAQQGYKKLDVNLAEISATLRYRGFWAMVRKYWKTGTYEFYRSLSKRAFLRALRKLIPALEQGDIERGGAGVRAQAVSPDGTLVDDFKIVSTHHAIHVLNAPSPAATASLAIGRHVVGLASEAFDLDG